MQIRELNHVALLVADLDRSCEFYLRVLKLPPIPRPAFDFPGAWFRLGGQQELHLIGGRTEQVVAGDHSNHFALLTDDLDAWETHLTSVSADFRPKKSRPDGAGQIFLRDPDSHVIELCTSPPAK
jgi:catechol 2,3-dioxygenase-like lactoylglutathione lyase family enzyme